LCVLAEEVLRASAGFIPDVVISFATPTDFLAPSWPGTLRLHVEAGPYSRNPYPESLFFDHLGMYGRSIIARAPTRLREFTVQAEQAGFVAAFRRHYAAVLETIDPFRDIDLRGPFDRVCLLALQVSDWYGFDEQVTYRTQFEFLIDVLSANAARCTRGRDRISGLGSCDQAVGSWSESRLLAPDLSQHVVP
jgi:hypothetical protein